MPDHLRAAAARRSQDAAECARRALVEMRTAGTMISFTAVARHAGISTDFLYRHPELRTKIEALRQASSRATPPSDPAPEVTGGAVTALAERLRWLQAERHAEVTELKAALAAAHGENLALRRRMEAAGVALHPNMTSRAARSLHGQDGRMSQLPTLSALEITSQRLVLRKAHDPDRDGLIELLTDDEIRAYLGGPRPRSVVEQHFDAVGAASATSKPGGYVIADSTTNQLVGTLVLDHRAAARPGHLTEGGEELELSYVLRRSAWGMGLAFEAATAALRAATDELPDQPVVVVTQTANQRSLKLATRLGFHQVHTFEEFGAQQTLATARLHSFKA